MRCELRIDNQPFSFPLEGHFQWGSDGVLFRQHQQVLDHCAWKSRGYTVFSGLNPAEWESIRQSVTQVLQPLLEANGTPAPADWVLENYHQYVQTPEQHQRVIEKTRFLTYADLPIDFPRLAAHISEQVHYPMSLHNPRLEREIVILRISRPQSLDINPPHRDGYLPIWERVLNVWIPVAGCHALSSLPVIPGSHYWNEKDICRTEARGASIGGLRYHVPGIVQTRFGLPMIRPNPQPGEILLFTPFLIHGAAINQHASQTRMALELRLSWEES